MAWFLRPEPRHDREHRRHFSQTGTTRRQSRWTAGSGLAGRVAPATSRSARGPVGCPADGAADPWAVGSHQRRSETGRQGAGAIRQTPHPMPPPRNVPPETWLDHGPGIGPLPWRGERRSVTTGQCPGLAPDSSPRLVLSEPAPYKQLWIWSLNRTALPATATEHIAAQ